MKFTETPPSATPEYTHWLQEIKSKIKQAQIRAALAASRELILFYWDLGKSISKALQANTWGNKAINQLSKDLASEFPGIQGFSRRNLYYVKKFYEFFSDFSDTEVIVPRDGAQLQNDIEPQTEEQIAPPIINLIGGHLPWGHIKIILDKVKDSDLQGLEPENQ